MFPACPVGIVRLRPTDGAPVEAAAKKRTEIANFMALLFLVVLLLLESEVDLLSDAGHGSIYTCELGPFTSEPPGLPSSDRQ